MGKKEYISEQEWLDIFGDNLRSMMDEYRYSQKELAEVTGLSQSTICKYINKQQMPTIKAIINLSYELGCDLYDLIDFGSKIR